MANSFVTFNADGVQDTYSFSFGYLLEDHIDVLVDGSAVSFTWVNNNTVKLDSVPTNGSVVRVERNTPSDAPFIDFTDGSTLLEKQLDDQALQTIYILQETVDSVTNTLQLDSSDSWDALDKRITNVADAVDPVDAMPLGQGLSIRTDAEAARDAAQTAETGASTARNQAVTARDAAQQAQSDAESAQTAAQTAQNAAEMAETNAASSASAALTSETNAAASATSASTSETNAASSASAAQSAETSAAGSESAAAASATNAATSEAKAQDWATKTEDTEVDTGLYSAFHWAKKAEAEAASITSSGTTPAKVQEQEHVHATDTGAGNAYAIAPSPAVSSLVTGHRFSFEALNANTGGSTLSVSGLPAASIKKWQEGSKVDLEADDISAGQIIEVTYDGTHFVAHGVGGGSASVNRVGQVVYFAMDTAPTGFLECNGATISRTTYSDLFTKIGTTFGTGDGSTTFGIPDLRGEFIRGWDNGRGVDSGRTFGAAQADQFEAHSHTEHTADGGGSSVYGAAGTGGLYLSNRHQSGTTGGSETRPRNIALLPCIQYAAE